LDWVFPIDKEQFMSRPPMFKVSEKQRIVLSVLRGEATVVEAARRNKCSETSVAKWRDHFLAGGVSALEAGAPRGPSGREAQLERELGEVTSALGEAHVKLRLAEREGLGFASRSWR
jgi:transposase